MRAKNRWGILLVAIMVFSMLLVVPPPFVASDFTAGPPIVVDGDIGDWLPISPLIVDEVGDTYPWSSNAAIINSQNSTVWEANVAMTDKTRDLVALYMWFDDPEWVYMRIDYQDLWYKFSFPWDNGSMTAIYFDLDQEPGSGMPDASAAGDYSFAALGAEWDFKIEGDENAWYAAIGWNTVGWNNWTGVSYPAQSDDYTDNSIHYFYNYDANCVELAINRTVLEDFTGIPAEKVGLTVLTYKKGEEWGNYGAGWRRAFDPQAPGLPGENWGWDTAATGWVKPACTAGFGPTPAQAAANPPGSFPPYPWPTGAIPGIYAPATGLGAGDPHMADIADLLDTVAGPGGLTPGAPGGEDWIRNDEVNSDAHFKVDMTLGSRIEIIDAATGQENITCEYDPCEQFKINITLCNAIDLYAWGLVISWDPAILECKTGSIVFDPWWGWDIAMPGEIDNATGTWSPGWGATETGAAGVSNPGCRALLQAEFHVKAYGTTWINITVFDAANSLGVKDLIPKKNALLVSMFKAEYHGPTVEIHQDPAIPPYWAGEPIDLWAVCTPGWYTTLGGRVDVHCNNCTWDVVDMTTGNHMDVMTPTGLATTPVVVDCQLYPTCPITFTPPECHETDYSITVVCKLKPDPELDSRGLNTASDTEIKHVICRPVGCAIDLFTEEERFQQPLELTYGVRHWRGIGPYMPADAYRPDEEVTLFAEVTYGGDPRQGYLVAFEVHDALCNNVLVETAMTNKSGIATISFRIPTVCPDPTAQFGKWWAIAKVSVCEVKQNDTIEWQVRWVVELLSVEADYNLDPGAFLKKKGDWGLECMTFGIWIQSWALVPKNVTIVVNVHDADNVVIAVNKFTMKVEPAILIGPDPTKPWQKCRWTWEPIPQFYNKTCMQIPQWTYPGYCIVKVGAFYELPIDTGVPYCPMVEAMFKIKAV